MIVNSNHNSYLNVSIVENVALYVIWLHKGNCYCLYVLSILQIVGCIRWQPVVLQLVGCIRRQHISVGSVAACRLH